MIAVVIYALVGWLVVRLIWLVSRPRARQCQHLREF
jgi:hypothetical protein